MPQLPSLPQNAHLRDLLARFPKNVEPLMIFVNAVLRSEGALTIAERELIAAYVSGLNACRFCYGSHVIHAENLGVDPNLLENLLNNIETAGISNKMKSLLRYVEKLNSLPNRLVQADLDAVLSHGWSEEAVFEAVEVTGLFNMMNRIVEGGGVTFDYAGNAQGHTSQNAGPEVAKNSYLMFLETIQQQVADREKAAR
ncbi:peroxidase-related enzyme [Shimia sp. SDUM112013]|uniref:carboxymuconolactone decarboxylase family protein n=1 Tax=Shimia sp. SDUM112013 TaxID=3136160 RepID=UPI0032EB14E9